MKKSASLKITAVRDGLYASAAADAALAAFLAPWRARTAWLALVLAALYWFWW